MIHFLSNSFSFPVFSKIEIYISAISHSTDLKFWTNILIDRPYKILTSKTGNVMIHFLSNSFSFPVFSKLEIYISAISHSTGLKFWTNTYIGGSYKIMNSKTWNVNIHFLLISISFPVLKLKMKKILLCISQTFLNKSIWNFEQVST